MGKTLLFGAAIITVVCVLVKAREQLQDSIDARRSEAFGERVRDSYNSKKSEVGRQIRDVEYTIS